MTTPDSQEMGLREELARVLVLLEKATPGPWLDHGFHDDGVDGERVIAQHRSEAMGYAVACALPCGEPDARPELTEANAQSIAAAINFLRKHGAHIAETFKETPNG